ncbi:MAG TPA: M64 family metallopeptidase [Thermoanaerobaculia bacterium]|jgi:hypothetical protein
MKIGRGTWWAAGMALCALACAGHCPPPQTAPVSTTAPHDALPNTAESQRTYFIAVLGDGYGTGEQATFDADVRYLLEPGALMFPPFDKHIEVRKIPLVSQEAGVSTETIPHTTALGITFNGRQADCYFTLSPDALSKITHAARSKGDVDYTVVLVNALGASGVGCAVKDRIALITRNNASAAKLTHEFGHTIGDLFDEYSSAANDTSSISFGNCTTDEDATNSPWSDLFVGTVTVPSDPQAGPEVGMYLGCNHRDTDIFRPMKSCMMNLANDFFCKVCFRILDRALKSPRPVPPAAGPTANWVHFRLLVRPGTSVQPQIIDQWASNVAPPAGPLPVHGLWALTFGNDVLAAVGATGDLSSWRAYGEGLSLAQAEQYVPAPYQVVDLAIPRSRLTPHPGETPQLKLFAFDDGRLQSNLIETIPPEFAKPKVIGQSPELTSAIQNLLQ